MALDRGSCKRFKSWVVLSGSPDFLYRLVGLVTVLFDHSSHPSGTKWNSSKICHWTTDNYTPLWARLMLVWRGTSWLPVVTVNWLNGHTKFLVHMQKRLRDSQNSIRRSETSSKFHSVSCKEAVLWISKVIASWHFHWRCWKVSRDIASVRNSF